MRKGLHMTINESLLRALKIDNIPVNRQYWFIRTNGGEYFEEFFFNGYVGIEWDEIVSHDYTSLDDLKDQVVERYPREARPGYIAGQIDTFVKKIKKGDIVIIPNKDSKFFAFGEISDDSYYLEEEVADNHLIFEEDLESVNKVLHKRRKVNWIKCFNRSDLDNRLQTFIYAHNTIVDLNKYALYIDRTLSNYYVKGNDAYFTFKVNRTARIPLYSMADMFVFVRDICEFCNEYVLSKEEHISPEDFSSKVDVQSKGPFQLSGPIKKIFAVSCILTIICGGSVKIDKTGFEVESNGVMDVLQSVMDIQQSVSEQRKETKYDQLLEDYEKLESDFNSCKEKLLLTTPEMTTSDTIIEGEIIPVEVQQ